MKFNKNIEAFIEKRIAGKSFDEIAKELKTAKSTLIEWNKKATIRDAIEEGKAFAINSLVKAYSFDRQQRLKAMLELSQRINTELAARDLSDVPTDKLLQMLVTNDNRLKSFTGGHFQIGENESVTNLSSGSGFFYFGYDE